MAYRNGTYVAFHAEGNSDPTETDMKYYRLLHAWHAHEKIEFTLINSHDKASAVRDKSLRETLRRQLAGAAPQFAQHGADHSGHDAVGPRLGTVRNCAGGRFL